VHLVEMIIAGAVNQLRSMFIGKYEIHSENAEESL